MSKSRIVFIIFICFPLILLSQDFWQIEQLSKMNGRDGIGFPDIACGSDGSVHMIFSESDRNGEHLVYTTKMGGSWSAPVMVQAGGGGWYNAAVAADGNGSAYVIFTLAERLYLWHSIPGFGDPVEIITDVDPGLRPFHPDIVLDNNNNIHIVFLSWKTDVFGSVVYYSNNMSGSFAAPVMIDSNEYQNFTSIAVDENNKVGIVYHRADENTSALKTYYTSNMSGTFIAPLEVSVTPGDTSDTRDAELKLNNGYAYITYSQWGHYSCTIGCNPGNNDLYFTKLNALTGDHIIPPLPVQLQVGWDNFGMSFVPGGDGIPSQVHVAYYDFHEVQGRKSTYWQSRLRYLVVNSDDGTFLQAPETVYDQAAVGEPALEVDDQGFAHIAFHSEDKPMHATNVVAAGGTMHIASIEMSTQLAGKNVFANATVTIHDENNAPVPDVTISGVWSGLTSDSDQFVSGPDGTGSASSDKVSKQSSGLYTFTVTDISRPGWTYDPSANQQDNASVPWNLSKPNMTISEKLPASTLLIGNFPNPFNPGTTICFQLAANENVRLIIYDIRGQKVRTLINSAQPAGSYQIPWDGNNSDGLAVSTGIYIYSLSAGSYQHSKIMMLSK